MTPRPRHHRRVYRLAILGALVIATGCSSRSRPPPRPYGPPPPGYGYPPRPGYGAPPPQQPRAYAPPPAPAAARPLTQADIKAGINRAQPDIKACFGQAMLGDRGVSGRAQVRFVIQPSGQVTDVTIQESNLPPQMNGCIVQVLQRLTYHPHPGPAQGVVYPIAFN